jgi:hypothetical protein
MDKTIQHHFYINEHQEPWKLLFKEIYNFRHRSYMDDRKERIDNAEIVLSPKLFHTCLTDKEFVLQTDFCNPNFISNKDADTIMGIKMIIDNSIEDNKFIIRTEPDRIYYANVRAN